MNMKLSGLIARRGMALGLCLSVLPLAAEAETATDRPGLYTSNIFEVTTGVFINLSEMPIDKTGVQLIWVDINESNLEAIVRQMADARIPDELSGWSFNVTWYKECRFGVDMNIAMPRRDPTSNFSDDEKAVVQYLIELVIQTQLANVKTQIEALQEVDLVSCKDRPESFKEIRGGLFPVTDAVTRGNYKVGGDLMLDTLSAINN
jgi:hypothetical protein